MNSEHCFLRPSLAATLLVSLIMLSCHTLFAASTYSGCGGEIVSPTNVTYEERVIELVNEARATHGLPPMKLSADLTNAARYHATDMHQDEYVNHQTFDRNNGVLVTVCDWDDRIRVYYTGWNGLAENLVAGSASPEEAVAGWLNSSGHRENILGTYREIGVGYAAGYWAQNFGDRSDYYPVIINREAQQTDSTEVSLYIYGDWQQMRLRNDEDSWGEWQTFQQELSWSLSNIAGERRVEVEVSDSTTQVSASDTILLSTDVTPTPLPIATVAANASIYLPTIRR